jgi:hypothetical protein
LRAPQTADEVPKGTTPDASENPFYCLLESDTLITELSVTTDRLLKPVSESHVLLIIKVVPEKTITSLGTATWLDG